MEHVLGTGLEGLWICGACGGINGRPKGLDPRRGRGDQRCTCRPDPDEPTWDRFDYNQYVRLCRCCLQEVLRSGSRFSCWFCPECSRRVVALNDRLRVWLIPIGPHSFMARTYDPPGPVMLSGSVAVTPGDPASEAAIERFCTAAVGLFDRIGMLQAWSESALLQNLRDLRFTPGQDVRLPEYLSAIRARAAEDAHFTKRAAFERLREHMRGEGTAVTPR